MPVIECTCGMVMSVPAGAARASCIRCGGAEFHILKHSGLRPRHDVASTRQKPTFPVSVIAAAEFTVPVNSIAVT
jgi:hypothetical protein